MSHSYFYFSAYAYFIAILVLKFLVHYNILCRKYYYAHAI